MVFIASPIFHTTNEPFVLSISFSMLMFLKHSFKNIIASNLSVGFIHVGNFLTCMIKYSLLPSFT